MKTNEDPMAVRSASKKGDGDFPSAAIFLGSECRTHGPRMKDDGGRENGAFYGFIMRMVDQRGTSLQHMAARVSTAFPDHTREDIYARVRTAKGVTALQLSTTKPGNEPSRSLGLFPNKIYIRIQGETSLFFFTSTPPYIILGVSSRRRTPLYSRLCITFQS